MATLCYIGTQVTLTERGTAPPPIFAYICCGQMARFIKMPLCRKVCLDPSDIVLDGNPASPPRKKWTQRRPKFSAHVNCGQTAGWIKMPLGTEVGFDPSDTVLDNNNNNNSGFI